MGALSLTSGHDYTTASYTMTSCSKQSLNPAPPNDSTFFSDHKNTYIHIHIQLDGVHVYMHRVLYVLQACMYLYVYVHVYVYVCVYVYVYVYACMYVCMYVCIGRGKNYSGPLTENTAINLRGSHVSSPCVLPQPVHSLWQYQNALKK